MSHGHVAREREKLEYFPRNINISSHYRAERERERKRGKIGKKVFHYEKLLLKL
jgi:hypothetical protein